MTKKMISDPKPHGYILLAVLPAATVGALSVAVACPESALVGYLTGLAMRPSLCNTQRHALHSHYRDDAKITPYFLHVIYPRGVVCDPIYPLTNETTSTLPSVVNVVDW